MADRAGCGAIRSTRPPVPTTGASDTQLAADRVDDAVDLAGEAVDEPRLQRARGGLADHLRRLDVVDLHEPGRPLEERLHRDLDPGSEHPADVRAVRRDDIEVRGGAEVRDDRRRAEAAPSPRPR